MMKKYLWILLSIFAIGLTTACNDNSPAVTTADSPSTEKLQIVTTIFPEYDWVKEIMGTRAESAEITLLMDDGVDLHSFQPTADDMIKIANADLFIHVGGASDRWLEDALAGASNEDRVVINLMGVLGDAVKTEETVEGMQPVEHNHDNEQEAHEESHDHDHEHEAHEESHDHDHEHEAHEDEHVWLSLKNAQRLCRVIADELSKIDTEYSETYGANADAYIKKLQVLDAEYEAVLKETPQNTLLFGDRFPYRYLVDDYHLEYYAAFVGCSAETEASFETITFLSAKVDELGLHTVMTNEKSDQKIAKTIIQNTKSKDQNILSLDSIQSVTADEVEKGTTYLSIMESNLAVLKEALK